MRKFNRMSKKADSTSAALRRTCCAESLRRSSRPTRLASFTSLMFQSPAMRKTSLQLSAAVAASLGSSLMAVVGTSKLWMLPMRKRSPLEEAKLITSTLPG